MCECQNGRIIVPQHDLGCEWRPNLKALRALPEAVRDEIENAVAAIIHRHYDEPNLTVISTCEDMRRQAYHRTVCITFEVTK